MFLFSFFVQQVDFYVLVQFFCSAGRFLCSCSVFCSVGRFLCSCSVFLFSSIKANLRLESLHNVYV